jgi:aspartyl-tRNA(Asn)/glutamyl-tRNA(Gln) amidotransferase subunit B
MTEIRGVIGLEVHAQLATRTKLFCADEVVHAGPPNRYVCPVCLGLPGALPVPNERAVELAIRAAALFGCTVHPVSRFVRKSYFYPDLPKGYQITQLHEPLATSGALTLQSGEHIRIRRLHIEEDAGKLLHDRIDGRTAIDLNRCGIPLLEIVTEPDFRTAAAAASFGREIRQLLRYAGVSDCDMELGSLRIDANVSIRGDARAELKNLNSFAHLERAIDEEIARQGRVIEAGGAVTNETLAWDADAQQLRVLRAKESAAEYRYLVEPDLPPLVVSDELMSRATAGMPEPPSARAARFERDMAIPAGNARALTATRALADYFEAVATNGDRDDPGLAARAASWVMGDVLAWCNANSADIDSYPVPPASLRSLLVRVGAGDITRAAAREALKQLEQGTPDVDSVIAAAYAAGRPDAGTLERIVDAVLTEEASLAARYRAGETQVFGYLMGQLMRRAGTGVEPKVAVDMLRSRLDA